MHLSRGELIAVCITLGALGVFTWQAMRLSPVVLQGAPMQFVSPPPEGEAAPEVTIVYTAIGRMGRRSDPITLVERVPFRLEIPGDSIEGTATSKSPNVNLSVEISGSGHTRSKSSHGNDGATFSFSGGTNRWPLWTSLLANAICVALLAAFIVLGRFRRRRRMALEP